MMSLWLLCQKIRKRARRKCPSPRFKLSRKNQKRKSRRRRPSWLENRLQRCLQEKLVQDPEAQSSKVLQKLAINNRKLKRADPNQRKNLLFKPQHQRKKLPLRLLLTKLNYSVARSQRILRRRPQTSQAKPLSTCKAKLRRLLASWSIKI